MIEQQTEKIEKIKLQIKDHEKKITTYKYLAITLGIIGFLLIFRFQYLLNTGTPEQNDLLDKLGSISGGIVSSTFSLAGLFLVYVAFLGQKQQLLHQQIELELTRSEMKKQNETLELQKFENLFFQLLSNYQNTKKIFYMLAEKSLFEKFISTFEIKVFNKKTLNIEDPIVKEGYDHSLLRINLDLSFLLQVNSILKFIYQNENGFIDPKLYIDIFNSTISTPERKCIFLIYNLGHGLNIDELDNIDKSGLLIGITLANI